MRIFESLYEVRTTRGDAWYVPRAYPVLGSFQFRDEARECAYVEMAALEKYRTRLLKRELTKARVFIVDATTNMAVEEWIMYKHGHWVHRRWL